MQYTEIETLKNTEKSTVSVGMFNHRAAVRKQLYKANPQVYRILMQKKSNYIPEIYSVADNEEYIEVIEEYVEGETLDAYIAADSPDRETRLDIALRLCDAVHYIHNFIPPVIHRDIKPSNIIITPTGDIKLIDFDAARIYDKNKSDSDTVLLGTKEYAAPEQYGYSQTDIRTDIYALGIVLKNLDPGFDSPSLAAAFSKIIDRCTRFDPKDRYENTDALIKDIEALKFRNSHTGRTAAVIGGIAALLVIVVFAVIAVQNRIPQNTAQNAAQTEYAVSPGDSSIPSGDTPEAAGAARTEGSGADIIADMAENSGADAISGTAEGSGADAISGTAEGSDAEEESEENRCVVYARISDNPSDRIYYSGEYYETEYIHSHCYSSSRSENLTMHLMYDLAPEKYSEFDSDTIMLFDQTDRELYGMPSYHEYYPGELGLDYVVVMRNNSVIGYDLCAVTLTNMLTEEEFRVPDDMWYSCCGAIFIDIRYLTSLENTLYCVHVFSVSENGDFREYIERIVIHDANRRFETNLYSILNGDDFDKGRNSCSVFALEPNCELTIKKVTCPDSVTASYCKISEDGRVVYFGQESFDDCESGDFRSYQIETSDGEILPFIIYVN